MLCTDGLRRRHQINCHSELVSESCGAGHRCRDAWAPPFGGVTILWNKFFVVYNSPYIALNNFINNSVFSMSGIISIGFAPGYGISFVAFGIILCAAAVGLTKNLLS